MPSDRFSAANEKSGNADSPNIEFEVTKISLIIETTSTETPSSDSS